MSTREFRITANEASKRLDVHLSQHTSLSRSYLQKLIREGFITVNKKIVEASYKIKKDDRIFLNVPSPKKLEILPEKIPLAIVYEDNDLLVINKPKGMVTHPSCGHFTGTLVNGLLFHCKNLSGIGGVARPGIVHRLDKDTSGLLVVAKNDLAHKYLARQLNARTIKRVYIALAKGHLEKEEGIIDAPMARHPINRKKMTVVAADKFTPLDSKPRGIINIHEDKHLRGFTHSHPRLKIREAVTHYKVLKHFTHCTLLEIKPKTGRTHQIRVHLAYIGHPLVGDPVYARGQKGGQFLHAETLGFTHPRTKEYLEFSAPIPEEFLEVGEKYS